MHEAKLVRDLVTEIDSVARRNSASRVDVVHIEIGAHSHVTPASLERRFEVMAHGSLAQGAGLEITRIDDTTGPDAFDVRIVSIVVEEA
jgi:Zn finger protein HypA/HybF involved in hydrogenase expression